MYELSSIIHYRTEMDILVYYINEKTCPIGPWLKPGMNESFILEHNKLFCEQSYILVVSQHRTYPSTYYCTNMINLSLFWNFCDFENSQKIVYLELINRVAGGESSAGA
jgi:hypothetical protein